MSRLCACRWPQAASTARQQAIAGNKRIAARSWSTEQLNSTRAGGVHSTKYRRMYRKPFLGPRPGCRGARHTSIVPAQKTATRREASKSASLRSCDPASPVGERRAIWYRLAACVQRARCTLLAVAAAQSSPLALPHTAIAAGAASCGGGSLARLTHFNARSLGTWLKTAKTEHREVQRSKEREKKKGRKNVASGQTGIPPRAVRIGQVTSHGASHRTGLWKRKRTQTAYVSRSAGLWGSREGGEEMPGSRNWPDASRCWGVGRWAGGGVGLCFLVPRHEHEHARLVLFLFLSCLVVSRDRRLVRGGAVRIKDGSGLAAARRGAAGRGQRLVA